MKPAALTMLSTLRQCTLERSIVERLNLESAIRPHGRSTVRMADEDGKIGLTLCCCSPVDEDAVRTALSEFTPVWEALTTQEQGKVLRLLIRRIEYHGGTGKLEVIFEPTGFDGFLQQFTEEAAVA